MQSYLQFRRIHQAVQRQYNAPLREEEGNWNAGDTPQDDSSCCPDLPEKHQAPAQDSQVVVVSWDDYDIHLSPRQYSPQRKAWMTVLVALIGLSCTAASAIDSAGVPQISEHWGVSKVVGSLVTGMLPANCYHYSEMVTDTRTQPSSWSALGSALSYQGRFPRHLAGTWCIW